MTTINIFAGINKAMFIVINDVLRWIGPRCCEGIPDSGGEMLWAENKEQIQKKINKKRVRSKRDTKHKT